MNISAVSSLTPGKLSSLLFKFTENRKEELHSKVGSNRKPPCFKEFCGETRPGTISFTSSVFEQITGKPKLFPNKRVEVSEAQNWVDQRFLEFVSVIHLKRPSSITPQYMRCDGSCDTWWCHSYQLPRFQSEESLNVRSAATEVRQDRPALCQTRLGVNMIKLGEEPKPSQPFPLSALMETVCALLTLQLRRNRVGPVAPEGLRRGALLLHVLCAQTERRMWVWEHLLGRTPVLHAEELRSPFFFGLPHTGRLMSAELTSCSIVWVIVRLHTQKMKCAGTPHLPHRQTVGRKRAASQHGCMMQCSGGRSCSRSHLIALAGGVQLGHNILKVQLTDCDEITQTADSSNVLGSFVQNKCQQMTGCSGWSQEQQTFFCLTVVSAGKHQPCRFSDFIFSQLLYVTEAAYFLWGLVTYFI